MKSFDRRTALGMLAASAMIAPVSAFALNETQARSLVQSLAGEINTVITSGKSQTAMIRDFEAIFKRYADTAYVAAYAMGVDARRATAAQKRAFSDAFNTYIARKYGQRFNEFVGGRLEVSGVRQRNNYYEVSSTAFRDSGAPFNVTFHVSNRSGSNKFFNMYVEGVNMLLAERTEVGALLDRRGGNIDAMIADLRAAI